MQIKNKFQSTKSLVVSGVVAAAVAGGGAYAAIPSSSDGTISSCYGPDGIVKVIDAQAGATCPAGSTPLSWNQRGRTGPTGPRGSDGAPYFARILSTDNATYKYSRIAMKTWEYSDGTIWINVPDRDVRQCAVTATPVTSKAGATIVRQQVSYPDWILLYAYAQGARSAMDADVILACNY